MTFRHAALIHKRHQQPRRRIIPGVALAAAALVAAVLFLATSSNIQAETPPAGPRDTLFCRGLSTITIAASDSDFGDSDRLQHSTVSANGDCDVTVTVIREVPNELIDGSCVVTVSPRAVEGRGSAGTVSFDGSCERRSVEWSVSIHAAAVVEAGTGASSASDGSSNSTTAYGKITGDDAIGFDLFWHYSKVTWTHTETAVLSATQYTNGWKRAHWVLISKSNNITKVNSTKYEAWSERDYMTTVLPAGNETKVTLHARLNGLFNCTYVSSPYHLWNFFGLDLDYECQVGSP